MFMTSNAAPNFLSSLSNIKDIVPETQQSKSLQFMLKNAFIDEFLDYADEDGVYNYIF